MSQKVKPYCIFLLLSSTPGDDVKKLLTLFVIPLPYSTHVFIFFYVISLFMQYVIGHLQDEPKIKLRCASPLTIYHKSREKYIRIYWVGWFRMFNLFYNTINKLFIYISI